MAKISIISSVYNIGREGLNRCLSSLTTQTEKDIQIIFVDDHSTDDSLAVLKEWATKDNRLIVIESEKRGGAAVARNKALRVATGEYVAFTDADDSLDAEFCAVLYNEATKDGTPKDIAKAIIKETTLNEGVRVSDMNERIAKGGIGEMYTEWTSAIFRRDLLVENNIDFPEQCPKSQHIVFLNRIITAADENSFVLTDKVAYNYFRRSGGLDDPKIPMVNFQSALRAVDIIMEELNNADLKPETYLRRYQLQYSALIEHTATQSREPEGNILAAEALIKHFRQCKDKAGLDTYIKEMYPPLYEAIVNKDAEKIVADYLGKYTGYKSFAKENNNGRSGLAKTHAIPMEPVLIIKAKEEKQTTEPVKCTERKIEKPKEDHCNTLA